MKQLRHVLALTLVFCMVFGMVTPSLAVSGEISVEEDYGIPVEEDGGIEIEVDDRSDYDIDEDREELSVLPKQDETADETNTTDKVDGYNYNIIHLDCGRKYFSVDSIKQIIDNASAAGFNYIQLAVGNDGMRFLLDDMSLKIDENTTYSSEAVKAAIHAGNEAYNKSAKYNNKAYVTDTNELTQPEMDTIIAYAYEKGMGVIPLINTPGHMDAILDAAEALTGKTCSYNGSVRTIDVTNTTAVAFTEAFLNKYITYFAGKGCTLFNMGADEYANDIYLKYTGMGFGKLQDANQYNYFASYVNKIAGNIKSAGMKPMAFNDGIYFGSVESTTPEFDKDIIIEYWSSGWPGYTPRSASGLAAKGFKMVNTHGDYYWVLGKPDAQCSATKASGFDKTVFPGSTISNPGGSTFCIWSDYPGAETEASVITKTADTIEAFGGTLPNLNPTVTVSVNQTVERTQDGVNNENNVDRRELDENIATVVVTGTDAVAGNVSYKSINSRVSYSTVAGENTSMAKTDYYYKVDSNYYPVYAYYATDYYYGFYTVYYIGYSTTDSADNVTLIVNSETNSYFDRNTLYTKSGTAPVPASTTITITGKTVGTTYITVGGVRYTINVIAENLTDVTSITVEYWITNSRLTGTESKKNHVTITAQEAFGEGGVDIVAKVDPEGNKDNRTQEYWQSKILDVEKTNTSTSGTELQTTKEGDDETLNGSAFTKIRYYNSKWQVYTTTWTDVDRTQVNVDTYTGDKNQLVAYYMEVVDINNANGESELHVNAADWGTKGNGGNWGYNPEDDRCSVSVQIVYEDNSTNPTDTTANNLKSKTIVYGYWSGGRGLGTMIFSGQQNYQIYKVTAETGDMTSSESGNYVTVTSFTWDKNEETVWEGDATKSVSIGNPARKPSYVAPYDNLAWNTSNYNKNNAILIRVYVKTGVTEDSLTVHYIDKTLNEEFYNYNIAVASGTYFDSAFGKGGGNTLVNNSVKNINGVTQSVNADLKTMPEISAYYRYSEFTLDSVKRSDNGKKVWLYYTFNNTHNFVVDFGVPLHLEPSDIGIGETSGTQKWDTAELTAGNKLIYGTVDIAAGEGLTYTPTSVMKGVETIGITLSESNSTAKPATHFIYLYPATNVLYEEDVITNPAGSGWTTVEDTNYALPDGVTTQTTEKLGEENLHGYDNYYSENTEFSGGSAYMATLDASKTATEYGKPLTFEFTGNGFDLISECGPQTGALLVRVYKDGVLNHGFFVDTYFTGDNIGIINSAADNNGVLDYQVPVVRDINLTHGTYKVEVYGYMVNRSTTSTASLYSVDSAETYLEQALKDLGLDDDASLYEVSFMDENSVLNDNAVASDVVRSGVSVQSMADEVMAATDNTQYVYVDGIRVYGTLENNPGYTAKEVNTKYYNVYDFALNSSAGVSDKWDNNSLIYVEKDGNKNLFTIADYKKQGPENEIYLTSGNAVAFVLDGYSDINSTVHISAKAVSGAPIFNGQEVLTNTEMYYDVSELVLSDEKYGKYIVLKNDAVDDTVLSISGIKVSSNIELIANADFGEFIVKELTPAQDDEFKPETFKASIPKSVKKNRKFSISASASADVQEVVVKDSDGNVIISKTQDKANNSSSPYRYSLLVTAPNISGNYSVKVYAKDVNGKLSAPIELTIEVK